MDAMTPEEVKELEANRASWVRADEVARMSVDEIRKSGFGRNKTGKQNARMIESVLSLI